MAAWFGLRPRPRPVLGAETGDLEEARDGRGEVVERGGAARCAHLLVPEFQHEAKHGLFLAQIARVHLGVELHGAPASPGRPTNGVLARVHAIGEAVVLGGGHEGRVRARGPRQDELWVRELQNEVVATVVHVVVHPAAVLGPAVGPALAVGAVASPELVAGVRAQRSHLTFERKVRNDLRRGAHLGAVERAPRVPRRVLRVNVHDDGRQAIVGEAPDAVQEQQKRDQAPRNAIALRRRGGGRRVSTLETSQTQRRARSSTAKATYPRSEERVIGVHRKAEDEQTRLHPAVLPNVIQVLAPKDVVPVAVVKVLEGGHGPLHGGRPCRQIEGRQRGSWEQRGLHRTLHALLGGEGIDLRLQTQCDQLETRKSCAAASPERFSKFLFGLGGLLLAVVVIRGQPGGLFLA